jgi:hypothetical protein
MFSTASSLASDPLPRRRPLPRVTAHGQAGVLNWAGVAGWCESLVRGRRQQALRARISGLAEHEGALAELAAVVEERFVALGGALQDQAELSGRLVRNGSALLQLSGDGQGDHHDALREATNLIQHTLALAQESTGATVALFERMDRYHVQIGRLLEEERSVERTLAPLRIIQALFRIESASLPVDVQTAFAALAGEIPRFEAQVRDAFAQHAEVLSVTRREIVATTARLREGELERCTAIAARRQRIGDTLTALEREVAEIRSRDGRLDALIKQIDHCASAVVVSLQYQDITRQKMEHVRQALRDIASRPEPTGRAQVATDLNFLHNACRLEAGQAEAIRGELQHAVTTVTVGARDILQGLKRIETECWPRAEIDNATAATVARVQLLQTTLREAGALLAEAWDGARAAIALVRSFGGVASNVATTAREMAEGMRMIALNAQVQAAQAGEHGAGLLILAERTYLISEEIKLVTRNIGTEFTEAARQLDEVVAQGEALMSRATDQRTAAAAASARVEGNLNRHRDTSAELFQEIASLLAQIEARATAMARGAEFDDAFCLPLDRLRDHLREIASCVEASAHFRPDTSASLEGLKARYTMESERKVHAAALAGTPSPTVPAEPVSATDNVELF